MGTEAMATEFQGMLEARGVTRRSFMKLCGAVAVAAGLGELAAPRVAQALEESVIGATRGNLYPVIWIEGASCTGCTESFAQVETPDPATVVLEMISLNYSETLSAAAGHSMEEAKAQTIAAGNYILIYEGAVLEAFDGNALRVAGETGITAGLFTYPCLMAADILMYDADFVPVGVDQKQHVELTRDIAERFNNRYGETFRIPQPLTPKVGAKIYSLQNPTKKMSKSEDNPKATIDLLDDPAAARKKIMSAVTDSLGTIQYDPENQPGVSNLLMIHSSLSNEPLDALVARFQGKGYGDLKKETGQIVFDFLSDLQSRYREIIASGKIDEILREGNEKASRIAERKLRKVKKKLGFQILK